MLNQKRLKIGLFIDTFFPMIDGVIVVVDNYAKRLAEYADVTVFCPAPNEGEYDDSRFPYRVVRSNRLTFGHYDYSLATPKIDPDFLHVLNDADLDIVHIHSPFTIGLIGVEYAKKHHIPAIATLHSQFKQDIFNATHLHGLTAIILEGLMKVFEKCDVCWSVNDSIGELFRNEYHLHGKIVTHNNGTDLSLIEDKAASDRVVNEKYGIPEKNRVFVFTGRLVELKNVFLIVESLKIVKDAGIPFTMLFVGEGADHERLAARVEELGLCDCVKFLGRIADRDELSRIYRRADLFLFPSLYDASSLVQIEAASQKTAAVLLRGARTASTVTDGVNGFLSDPTAEAFAERVIGILGDEKMLREVSENAYRDLYVHWDDAVRLAYDAYLEEIERKKVGSEE